METKLEQIAASAVKHLPKSVVREIRTLRSVGAGGGRPPPATRWALSNERPYRVGYDVAVCVFANLNQYAATMHFVGQSTIFGLSSDRATGEAYCIAHHLTVDGEKRGMMVAYLRYLDAFVKMDGTWLFAERLLYVDWLEERALS